MSTLPSDSAAESPQSADGSTAQAAEQLPGVLVGHDTDQRRPTGVTVVLLPPGSTAGVAVRGAAPGTRETDLLDPTNTVTAVDAIVLAGGSAYGLDAATGVMGWLEEKGRGVEVGPVRVPIVPAAVLFDLFVGDASIRPDAASGQRACTAAVPITQAERGSVGAGAGATVGKLLGPSGVMRSGVGIASMSAAGITMSAVVAVNAVGDVLDPATGALLAGARLDPDSPEPTSAVEVLLAQLGGGPGAGDSGAGGASTLPSAGPAAETTGTAAPVASPTSGSTRHDGVADGPGAGAATLGASTTIGVVVTDAALTKTQASRLASVAHDGLARTIRPVHTTMDGDTLFAAATGTSPAPVPDLLVLSILAAEVTARAVLDAVRSARGLRTDSVWLPAFADRR